MNHDPEIRRLWHDGRSVNFYRPSVIPSPRRIPRWTYGVAFAFVAVAVFMLAWGLGELLFQWGTMG